MDGIEKLHEQMPLAYARTYLATGVKSLEYDDSLYARVDELQAIRKSAIQGEMRYCYAQAGVYLTEHPDAAASVEELLGEAVISGDDIRIGFGQEMYDIAPSLKVYELFMWFGTKELNDLRASVEGGVHS